MWIRNRIWNLFEPGSRIQVQNPGFTTIFFRTTAVSGSSESQQLWNRNQNCNFLKVYIII